MGGIVEYKAKRTEVMEITKRDGRKESFDSIKITNAIRKLSGLRMGTALSK